MPWGLHRYQQAGDLHFITFSCYRREPRLTPCLRRLFERALEQARRRYGFFVVGYVVMPEHVHLLLSEPERELLATAVKAMKQSVARQEGGRFWQERYYDFNVWSQRKRIEKLRHIHRNPIRRRLDSSPEEWEWSSFRHYMTGERGVVEIESQWTARKRETHPVKPKTAYPGHPHDWRELEPGHPPESNNLIVTVDAIELSALFGLRLQRVRARRNPFAESGPVVRAENVVIRYDAINRDIGEAFRVCIYLCLCSWPPDLAVGAYV